MTPAYRLYESIDQVPLNDWNEASQEGSHGFMDPDFLRAVEKGFAGEARIFHVLIYEEDGKPAACASLCLLACDLLLLAGPRLRRWAGWGRKFFPGLGKLNLLMCGLPFSAGQSHLAFAAGADRRRAVALLDTLVRQLARRHGARLIVFKEFSDDDGAHMDLLEERGYCRADTPATYVMPRPFSSLSAFCAALKSHYRTEIQRSQKKFVRAGCRVEHLDDPDVIRRVYTPQLHTLYEAVVGKAELKLEVLPHHFFHELAEQLPGRVTLTTIYRADQIVAFGWSLAAGSENHGLFCGIDYAHNSECDLYFNLMYHCLDCAFRSGSRHITMGQTADTFKTRLGCSGRRRCLYARGAGPLVSWVLRRVAGLLFPLRQPLDAKDVFKTAAVESSPKEILAA
jgi:predicted N-acyltransferase